MTEHEQPHTTEQLRLIEPTPENRQLVSIILGPVRPDWSNALMVGHPVHVVDGHLLRGYVPQMNAITGSVKTYDDEQGHECIAAQLKDFPIPTTHAWHTKAGTA